MEISISLVFPETSSCQSCQNEVLWVSCLVGTCCPGEIISVLYLLLLEPMPRTKVVEGITLSPKQREQAANLSMRTGQTQGTDQKDRDFDICAILCTWTPLSLSLSA